MTDPIYSGEAICKRWGDSSSGGRTVTLQLEADGEHPFRGYEGERFAVVFVPIGNDEKPMKKELMGDASTRKDEVSEGRFRVPPKADLSTSPTKPKKRWHDMPASQRAGMLMNDSEFQDYAARMTGMLSTATTADSFIKMKCDVKSKAELLGDAASRFQKIEGDFFAYRQAKQLGAA